MARRFIRIRQMALEAAKNYPSIPVPVELIVREKRIRIVQEPAADDVSGLAYRNDRDGQLTIGVNSTQSYRRQRFTIAHELFHILDHPGLRVDDRVVFGHRDNRREMTTEERDANLFASLLLMPAAAILKDLPVLERMTFEAGVRHLAARYEVSEQAMLIRLNEYIDYLLPSS